MGHVHTQLIIDRLRPRIVVPHHYYIWNIVQRQSTLLGAHDWVKTRDNVEHCDSSRRIYTIAELDKVENAVHFFGDNVAFDTEKWFEAGR